MSQEMLDMIKKGINFIQEDNSEEEDKTIKESKKNISQIKKDIVKKFISSKMQEETSDTKRIAEDFLISDNLLDKVIDVFKNKKDLEEVNFKNTTLTEIQSLQQDLEIAKTESELNSLKENYMLENNNSSTQENNNTPAQVNTTQTAPATTSTLENKETSQKSLIFIDKVKENQKEFGEKVIAISQRLGIQPNWLMRIMKKESGLNHKARNKVGGATGLIQFMPKTAKRLGTSTDELRNMTNIQQLDFVEKYYKPYTNKIKSYQDLYLTTFYPYAIGKPLDFIIGSEIGPQRAKIIGKQNQTMNNSKEISVNDVKKRIDKGIPAECKKEFGIV